MRGSARPAPTLRAGTPLRSSTVLDLCVFSFSFSFFMLVNIFPWVGGGHKSSGQTWGRHFKKSNEFAYDTFARSREGGGLESKVLTASLNCGEEAERKGGDKRPRPRETSGVPAQAPHRTHFLLRLRLRVG